MRPAVHAFQEHHVHAVEQFVDRIDYLDSHFSQFRREFLHAVAACRYIGAASGIGRHDRHVGQIAGGLRIVQHFSEGRNMRSVRPDNAHLERLGRLLGETLADRRSRQHAAHRRHN